MEDILYGISAFRYHRTPPQVRALLPYAPQREVDKHREALRAHPLFSEITSIPVHLMVNNHSGITGAKSVTSHLMTGPLPFGSVEETELGVLVSSPMMTLFQLARTISEVHLTMAIYEMCGTFSVFKPTPFIEQLLNENGDVGAMIGGTWDRVVGSDGRPSDLWRRPPLVELEELEQFADEMKDRRGGAAFRKAVKNVTGVVASPFEAQLSILLSLPRTKGGEGLTQFENNKRIALSSKARTLSGKSSCYADLLFEGCEHGRPLVLECQGKIVHGASAALMSDSDRTTALQEMGYDVVLLTYGQIANAKNFDIIRRMIFDKLGMKYREKTPKMKMREHDLRRNLFIDWSTLGI